MGILFDFVMVVDVALPEVVLAAAAAAVPTTAVVFAIIMPSDGLLLSLLLLDFVAVFVFVVAVVSVIAAGS